MKTTQDFANAWNCALKTAQKKLRELGVKPSKIEGKKYLFTELDFKKYTSSSKRGRPLKKTLSEDERDYKKAVAAWKELNKGQYVCGRCGRTFDYVTDLNYKLEGYRGCGVCNNCKLDLTHHKSLLSKCNAIREPLGHNDVIYTKKEMLEKFFDRKNEPFNFRINTIGVINGQKKWIVRRVSMALSDVLETVADFLIKGEHVGIIPYEYHEDFDEEN